MFVDADRAGNLGDTYAYNNSRLKRKIDQGRYLQERAKQISGVWFQPYLVADSTFTLFQSLIKGFPYPPAPTNQKFNTASVSLAVLPPLPCLFQVFPASISGRRPAGVSLDFVLRSNICLNLARSRFIFTHLLFSWRPVQVAIRNVTTNLVCVRLTLSCVNAGSYLTCCSIRGQSSCGGTWCRAGCGRWFRSCGCLLLL